MSNDNHKPCSDLDDFFGEPISVYSTDQAVEDGVLFEAGRLGGRRIILTTNLLSSITENSVIASVIVQCIEKSKSFEQLPDTELIKVGKQKFFVSDNGESITIMLPEDY
jgi:hypothetical protein